MKQKTRILIPSDRLSIKSSICPSCVFQFFFFFTSEIFFQMKAYQVAQCKKAKKKKKNKKQLSFSTP